jgi:hypothetical protein
VLLTPGTSVFERSVPEEEGVCDGHEDKFIDFAA